MRHLTKNHGLRGIALSGYGMAADRANTEAAGFSPISSSQSTLSNSIACCCKSRLSHQRERASI